MPDLVKVLEDMLQKFVDGLPSVIAALVIFIIAFYIAILARRAARLGMERRKMDPQVIPLVSKSIYLTVIILGLIVALQQVGFNVTAFLTGLGVVGFTIGFALQDVSKNFVSGLLLLLQEPFDIGETIEVKGFTGKVLAIDLRATEMQTLDGRIVVIPNADVFTNPITNFTRAASRRLEIKIGVAYDSDPELVRSTALEALAKVPGLLEEPSPQVVFDNFGSSTFDLTIYYWIDTAQTSVFEAQDSGLVAVNRLFQAAGIEMPFPTQLVQVQNQTTQ
ncbi:MAG TPA: mechanosensitive ion channel family protein [Anaerolineales bacterium]|nr:mechanosensitive ion channel family protein [Anaerolineales bacterium]